VKRPIQVLSVEDNEDDTRLLEQELRRGGFAPEVRRVETAEHMQQALEEVAWDVVLSDFSMPSFDARRALEVLKASGKDIPFIIVSGSIGEETAVDALKAGAHDFIVKQNLARLVPAVEREVSESRVRKERERALAALAESEARHVRLSAELQEALRVREEFLSVASHELKTPLTSLRLQAEGLQRAHLRGTLSPEKLGPKLVTMLDQINRLGDLINNLLDVTQIAAGQIRLRREVMSLSELVREVGLRFEDALEEAGCALSLELPQAAMGSWDRGRLEMVVANLLGNAIKYGPGKPIQLAVTEEGGVMRLTVRDEGIGIAPEDQARIFERFERAVSVRHYGGLGIGLWVSRQIVEAHGGRIHVRSAPGQGSTFTVELPRG